MNPALLKGMRIAVAALWFYHGLWLKLLRVDPQQLAVVTSAVALPIDPTFTLQLIGAGETAIAFAVLVNPWPRSIAWFQAVLLVAMNTVGILFAAPHIGDIAGMLAHNAPFLACIVALGVHDRPYEEAP